MKQPIQIQFHGMDVSASLEAAAREQAGTLACGCGQLVSCRVDIEWQPWHRQRGRAYGARVDLTLHGYEITASRVRYDNAYAALRDAFDSVRQLLNDVPLWERGRQGQMAALPDHAPRPGGDVPVGAFSPRLAVGTTSASAMTGA